MHRLLKTFLHASLLATLAACEPIRAVSADDPSETASVEATPRCKRCGWIEARREVGPRPEEPNGPVVYEYTVRMADGSLSQFREKHATQWRVGERLMVIAGEAGLGRARPAAAGR
jgi:hypothetical protein